MRLTLASRGGRGAGGRGRAAGARWGLRHRRARPRTPSPGPAGAPGSSSSVGLPDCGFMCHVEWWWLVASVSPRPRSGAAGRSRLHRTPATRLIRLGAAAGELPLPPAATQHQTTPPTPALATCLFHQGLHLHSK